jgi:excisionase family DNA binding protein
VLRVTVTETARALNVTAEDYIYRLIRTGALRAHKVGSKWDIDPLSVEERKTRVAMKRSSTSNVAAERAKRIAEAEGLFA